MLSRAKLGEAHPDTLNSMSALAMAYQAAGQGDRTLPLLKEAQRLMQDKLDKDHPRRLALMNNMALAYDTAGDLERALHLYE